jgi:GGDEF domain-containing protein
MDRTSPRPSFWRQIAQGCCILLLLAVGTGVAASEPEPARQWGAERAPAAQSWEDPSGIATFDAARAAFATGQGQPNNRSRVMSLGPARAVWYELALPPVTVPVRAVLTLPVAGLDAVEFYRPDGFGGWQMQRAGDSVPVADWPVRYLQPAFVFTVRPGEPRQTTYMRVRHSHPVAVSWVLRDASSFNEANKSWHLVLGGYAGIMILVLVLAGIHAVFWRDSIHLYFGVHVLLVGLTVLSLTGLAGEYLWPRNAWWNDIAPAVLAVAALAGMGLFMGQLVAERGRWLLSWVFGVQAAISLGIALGYVLLGRAPVFLLHNVNAGASLLLFVAVACWYARRRPEVGTWVLAGLVVLAAGACFPLLRNLGFEPPAFATQYGLQLGAAAEIPLVLTGLYFRSRERRDNQLRMHALPRTDPLTGVGSHRVLMERLQQLLERQRRDPQLGAVLRVRVGNLGTIANEFGREAAEAAMVRAAECLTREAREGDTTARDQNGDLVLVMEGRMTREQAMAAGRNIIAGGLKFSGRLPPGVTLSLQVAGACAPFPHGNSQLLLGSLGQLLQDIARDPGGRAMRIVQGPEPAEQGDDATTPSRVQ